MKKFTATAAALFLIGSAVSAAPSDIVPRGASINDWMAGLAARGYLSPGVSANDFVYEQQHTRDQLAEILFNSFAEPSVIESLGKDRQSEFLALQAIRYLAPELKSRDLDIEGLVANLNPKSSNFTGTLQPEIRVGSNGLGSKSGAFGIYRAQATGGLGTAFSYVLSASNWSQDWRRAFTNDIGPHDFSALNEGYLRYDGHRGLVVTAGRQNERWGPGLRGATMVSDNAPPFDEINLSFPFSLGWLGRDWRYTQFASTFRESGQQHYFEGRRVELNVDRHVTLEYQEAFHGSAARTLLFTPIPFLMAQGFVTKNVANYNGTVTSNVDEQFGMTYSPTAATRLYGQLMIDDLRSPFRGKFLGLSLGEGGVTPQRLAYLVGFSHETPSGTSITAEYTYADPLTYSDKNVNSWTNGMFDFIGLPTGSNEREVSGRIGQKVGPKIDLAVTYRNRWRRDLSYPAPTSREISGYASYKLDRRSSVRLGLHDYRQDAFPLLPGSPGYPTNPFVPISSANPGTRLRIDQIDVSYQITL